jgi:SNF2 family DNA or RNA helicase
VNVYKLISKGTIEEKILKMQEKKQGLFDSLINESEQSLKNVS